jgi:hypothetical protein
MAVYENLELPLNRSQFPLGAVVSEVNIQTGKLDLSLGGATAAAKLA